ncbi:MAG: 2-hydroxyacyl-CoA dehydratase family protein [Desulfobacterales bacterium]|jgi:benzoyl-CoA reductase/2-hydroxyglutaryl-CoA dehydratase subunit BcrC/BadD/HgdB|nr:2-hydroxyacyl-CoA dehydratase family protein [Desulfobacterales bacterium]
MGETVQTKYEWLRKLDAICDLFIGLIGSGAKTMADVDLPTFLQQIPEFHATLALGAYPEVFAAALKEKNRQAIYDQCVAMKQYLQDLFANMEQGKPLAYYFVTMTPEILHGLDLAPVCFELMPVFLSAVLRRGVEEEMDLLELKGLPTHLCSAQKGTVTAIEIGRMPMPDVMVKPSTPCDSSSMLYQYVMERNKVPLVVLDAPYYSNKRAFNYYHDEWKRMVESLEKITGRALNEDLLRKHVEYGNQQLWYLYELQKMRRAVPNPDPGMHRSFDVGSLYQCGTNARYVDYLKTCYEQAKARYDKGIGFLPEGKKEIRTLWTWGITPFYIDMYDWLEEDYGMSYLECAASYLPGDIVGLVNTTSVDSMIEGLAWRSFNMPMSRNVMSFSDIWINDFVNLAKTCHADAAVFSGHMACKHSWGVNKLLSDALQEEVGIPTFQWETDIVDARFTPRESAHDQLAEFFSNI